MPVKSGIQKFSNHCIPGKSSAVLSPLFGKTCPERAEGRGKRRFFCWNDGANYMPNFGSRT
jgi:hypothetical protein